MAEQGVHLVGEIGLGSVKDPKEASIMVKWAKQCNMTVMMHTGGTSISGSSTISADMVIKTNPDIASHVNGGPTSLSFKEIEKLVKKTDMILEIVHCGNPLIAVKAGEFFHKKNILHRVILGNDAPSGTGVVPLGIIRTINLLSGNTALVHKLNRGIIKKGKEADLVIMDAPIGYIGKDALSAIKAGDIPGISMVIVDGKIMVNPSRNTPFAAQQPKIEVLNQI